MASPRQEVYYGSATILADATGRVVAVSRGFPCPETANIRSPNALVGQAIDKLFGDNPTAVAWLSELFSQSNNAHLARPFRWATCDGSGRLCSGPQKLGTNSSVVTKTPQLPP